jgi:hypothetical protein
MRSDGAVLAGLLAGAGLAVMAAVTTPASASMLDVDGGALHHWSEPGPEVVDPPPTDEGDCEPRPHLPPQAHQPCPPPCEREASPARPPMCSSSHPAESSTEDEAKPSDDPAAPGKPGPPKGSGTDDKEQQPSTPSPVPATPAQGQAPASGPDDEASVQRTAPEALLETEATQQG